MSKETIKRTSYIAVASLMCALAAIASEILFALLVVIGADSGILIVASTYFVHTATILGILAIVVLTLRHKALKGYVYAVLAILLCAPFLYEDWQVRCVIKAREKRKKESSGLYNLELLGKDLVKYGKDNHGCLPVAERWCDLLMQHNDQLTKENFRHPKPDLFKLSGECHFAFNKNLSGLPITDIPDNVVLLFEADGRWNLNGTGELLRTRYREHGCICVLFADQTTGNYWYYMKAVRKFDKLGMYYESPRWKP